MSFTFVMAVLAVIGLIGLVVVLWFDRPTKSKQN